jgi:hypothetical protein
MYGKIRCDRESLKFFGFWGELNKALVMGLSRFIVQWPICSDLGCNLPDILFCLIVDF